MSILPGGGGARIFDACEQGPESDVQVHPSSVTTRSSGSVAILARGVELSVGQDSQGGAIFLQDAVFTSSRLVMRVTDDARSGWSGSGWFSLGFWRVRSSQVQGSGLFRRQRVVVAVASTSSAPPVELVFIKHSKNYSMRATALFLS